MTSAIVKITLASDVIRLPLKSSIVLASIAKNTSSNSSIAESGLTVIVLLSPEMSALKSMGCSLSLYLKVIRPSTFISLIDEPFSFRIASLNPSRISVSGETPVSPSAGSNVIIGAITSFR